MNLKKTLGYCYFTHGNFRQSKASTLEIPQNCVTLLLGNSKVQGQKPSTHANSTRVFLDPWKFYSFFNEPLEFWYTVDILLNNPSGNSITSTPYPHNACVGFFWNNPPFGPKSLKVFPHQYHEKILFGQLFFLHFSLERQDNHLQEFLLRKKGDNLTEKPKCCFCWDVNWWIGRRPRYRTRSHSCDYEVGIKLFNKSPHKIAQNETESFLKKDQVWTPLFSYMFSSWLFGFTSNIFMKLKVVRIEYANRILVAKNLYWQFDTAIFRETVIYAWY